MAVTSTKATTANKKDTTKPANKAPDQGKTKIVVSPTPKKTAAKPSAKPAEAKKEEKAPAKKAAPVKAAAKPAAKPAEAKKEEKAPVKKAAPAKTVAVKQPTKVVTPTASSKTIYHVSKRDNDGREWKVFIQGSDKVIKLFKTQAEALDYALNLVKNKGGEGHVHLHGLDGKIRKY